MIRYDSFHQFFRVVAFAFALVMAGLLRPSSARAEDVPQSFTLDGRLYSNAAATLALADGSIVFRVQILDEDKVCILYDEQQSISTAASGGYFSVQVGSALGSSVRVSGDPGNSMSQVFQNFTVINGKKVADGTACTAGPVAGKRRFVRIKISPSTMGGTERTLSPDLTIDSVPNAVVAERAETLQGLRAANVLQVNTAATNVLSQTNLENLFSSTARFSALTALVDGTSTAYVKSGGSGAQLPVITGAPSSPTQGAIWYDTSDHLLKYRTGLNTTLTLGTGSGSVSSVGLSAPTEFSVSGSPVTTSGTLSLSWANQGTNTVFAGPDGLVGAPTFRTLVANDIPSLPWSKITSGTPTTLAGYGITDAVSNAGGAGGDLSGTYPNPTVSKIRGVAVNSTAPSDGHVLRYNIASQEWTPANFSVGSLLTAAGAQQFSGSASCAASQTLTWSSLTDTFTCTNISGLAASVISSGTIASAQLGSGTANSTTYLRGDGTWTAPPTSQWTTTGSDIYYNSGNVGIGTTTPTHKLEVAGNIAGTTFRLPNPDGTYVSSIQLDGSNNTVLTGKLAGSDYFAIGGSGASESAALVIGTGDNGNEDIAFHTGLSGGSITGTERMRLKASTGNVGIGTTNPTALLHISGSNARTIIGGNQTTGLQIETNANGARSLYVLNDGNDFYLKNATTSTGAFLMRNSANSDIFKVAFAAPANSLTVASTGNIGIGTATPASSLDVNGAISAQGIAAATAGLSSAGQGRIYFDSTSNTFKVSQNGSAYSDLVGGGSLAGSGTIGKLVKFTAADAIGDSIVSESGSTVTINGSLALPTTSSSDGQILISGSRALHSYGTQNIFVGASSGNFTLTGAYNTALGAGSLQSDTTGEINTAIGHESMRDNTTGYNNTAVGAGAMKMSTNPKYNVAVGANAVQAISTGRENVSIGESSLFSNTTGSYNTAVGRWAGTNNVSGNNNVYLGRGAGTNSTGSGNVFIGADSGANETGSNKLYIANSNTTTPLIYGDFSDGYVGIGNNAPAGLLHVGSASVGTGQAVANFQNVDGTCSITPASFGSGIACSSDERLKENFQDVPGAFALDKILSLQAVTYNFKTSSDGSRRTGYKAQEVQKVAPEFVRENEDGLLQVYYDAFIPWITEATKSLYSRIKGLESHQVVQDHKIDALARELASAKAEANAKIARLEANNANKDNKIGQLEQENAALNARLEKIEKALNLERVSKHNQEP